jgi:hypothetical protein
MTTSRKAHAKRRKAKSKTYHLKKTSEQVTTKNAPKGPLG